MNRLEKRYAELLERRRQLGEIAWYKFEALKLRLGDNSFYTPDFAVMVSGGELQCHEVKGFWLEAARTKIKVAADLYPFHFLAVTAQRVKDGGGFNVEEF